MRRAIGVVLSSVGLAIVVASCGGQGPTGASVTTGPSGPSYEVMTRAVQGLGTILVDGDGYTLYLFMPDDHSSQSHCAGVCSEEWPPLLLPSSTTALRSGHGVRAKLLGTTKRADGTVQVTYAGWPLYLWPDDLSPGQATGEGLNNVGGLWYVVSPQGNPVIHS